MKVPYDVVLPQVNVLGSTMAYREAGNAQAPVALFLHGNPTSSYGWNLISIRDSARLGNCAGISSGSPQARVHPRACLHGVHPALPTWNEFDPGAIETFQKFRTPGVGEKMILEGNVFVEAVLPGATARKLMDEEMSVYRAPFPTPESRRPTWRFPNEIPIAGEPADVYLTAKGLKNCRVVQLSSGLHYLQEDHPDVIGATVKEWLIEVGIGSSPKQKAAV